MPPQVAMLLPILEGLDGGQKMSKSLGNYIGVTDAPADMFGKTMSISDELMSRYYSVLLGEEFPAAAHPMEAKKSLAARLVARFHSPAEAVAAREEFERRFSKRDIAGAELPEMTSDQLGADIVSAVVSAYAGAFDLVKSRGEARRLVEGGSIQWRGEKIADAKAQPDFSAGGVLKLDKLRAVRIAARP
jgi:tyrosyl-tRNA synthetase